MRKISLRELHNATGKWVREVANTEELIITERGRPIATIVRYQDPPRENKFKTRKLRPGYVKALAEMRRRGDSGTDSATIVSEDRDRV